MRTAVPALALTLILMTAVTPAESQQRQVLINRVRIPDQTLTALEQQWNTRVPDGRYWYDSFSGAWGMEGGPTAGWIPAGLQLGGPLRADASSGNTGVFVNGRELHLQDVAALMQIMPVYRGRWWVDAQGNFGAEGGPVLGNLRALAQQQAGGQYGSVYSNGGRDMLATDGNGCHYFNSHDYGTGTSTSWASPGC
jgi:hypothetical protein